MWPVGVRERLRPHLRHQAGEIAQAAGRIAVQAIEQPHRLADAAQRNRPLHRFGRHPLSVPVCRRAFVGESEPTLRPRRLTEHPSHLGAIRTDVCAGREAFPDHLATHLPTAIEPKTPCTTRLCLATGAGSPHPAPVSDSTGLNGTARATGIAG